MVGTQEVERVVREIWATTLADDSLERVERDPTAPAGRETAVACVAITGAWSATVRIACGLDFARRVATTMFEIPAEEVSEDELRDALGEIANMTAGNLKAMIPGNSALGLPMVVCGSFTSAIPGAFSAVEVAFKWGDADLEVSLLVPGGARDGANSQSEPVAKVAEGKVA